MILLDPELTRLHERFTSAACPEDLFGLLVGDDSQRLKMLEQQFRALSTACHPDQFANRSSDVQQQASEVFKLLQAFRVEAKKRLTDHSYGYRLPMPDQLSALPRIKTAKREYIVERRIAEGMIADLHEAFFLEGVAKRPVVLKICRETEDDALVANEAEALKRVENSAIPKLFEEFRAENGRPALVLEHTLGLDFLVLREKFPNGVDPYHAGWIFERLLAGLGALHKARILHGAIAPEHLMVYAPQHRGFLVDLTFCAIDPLKTGATLKGTIPQYAAPEVLARKPLTPAADLYALAKSMVFLMGGDPDAGTVSADAVPAKIRAFTEVFLKNNPDQRPQDAWLARKELHGIREYLHGSKLDFRDFKIP